MRNFDGGRITMIPGFKFSVISIRLTIPLKGNPLASPYDSSINERARSSVWSNAYLGNGYDVGTDTTVLRSKVLSGPPKTRLNFVQNQEDPMLIAYFVKTPQVRGGCGNIPAFPKDWFN